MITTYYSVRIISIRANVNKSLAGFKQHMKDIKVYMAREKLDSDLRKYVKIICMLGNSWIGQQKGTHGYLDLCYSSIVVVTVPKLAMAGKQTGQRFFNQTLVLGSIKWTPYSWHYYRNFYFTAC